MRIEIETSPYNERRYGKPWIATVDFKGTPNGVFSFGVWVGYAGSTGLLVLDVEHGQIVARGQKDNRKTRNSAPGWFTVNQEGKLVELEDKVSAYKIYRGEHQNAIHSSVEMENQ